MLTIMNLDHTGKSSVDSHGIIVTINSAAADGYILLEMLAVYIFSTYSASCKIKIIHISPSFLPYQFNQLVYIHIHVHIQAHVQAQAQAQA